MELLLEGVNEKVRSKCRHLGFSKDKIFLVDTGLNRVYVITESGADMFGGHGDKLGRFNSPSELALDDHGNSIVVDTGNNRLQMIDTKQNAVLIKVRMPFGYITALTP